MPSIKKSSLSLFYFSFSQIFASDRICGTNHRATPCNYHKYRESASEQILRNRQGKQASENGARAACQKKQQKQSERELFVFDTYNDRCNESKDKKDKICSHRPLVRNIRCEGKKSDQKASASDPHTGKQSYCKINDYIPPIHKHLTK